VKIFDHITRRDWLGANSLALLSASLSSSRASASNAGDPTWPVWDNHCHLAGLPGETPVERTKRLVELADRFGIERLVVFMGWPFSYNPPPDEFRRQNDQVLEAIAPWPKRVLGYAYVNPNHVEESLEEIARCIERGPMVGIKLWVARRCHEEALDPIIQMATRLNAAVYQHTWLKVDGNLPGESTPMDLAQLASRHPRARLICGHAGGEWESGIRAIRASKNVHLEVAGGDPTAGIVEMAVRELGAARVVYGSDAPGRSFASQLAKVLGARIPAPDKKRILSANLREMLGPILHAKGLDS